MNVVLDKIVAWLYLYEFSIVNMPYEMFLTIQLVYLTCREDRVQLPTRKEVWDLLWRTSDDSSRFTPISIHKYELEASIAKERALEEYRDNSTWRIVWRYFQRKQEDSDTL